MMNKQTLRRALRLKCPRCGEGALLHHFLKTVDHCNHCGEKIGHIRADDGPAWLTILIVGHIIVPFILMMVENQWLSYGGQILASLTLATICTAIIFPFSKSLFVSILWSQEQNKEE